MNPRVAGNQAVARSGKWPDLIPAGRWLRHYEPGWFRSDLAAGVTLAAYVLPAALGDASLAGLPPQAGLYACLFGGLVFWLLCSSRHTCISVTSAISLLVGSSLGNLAGGDPTRLGALAACAALLTATIAFAAWLARAGSVVNFISETVLIGFKAGVALQLASTQLPKLFAEKHGYRFDSNQEFLALAGANLASGLGYGFPVSGGMSQSLVNESGGARTPLSGLLCAILIALVAIFFSELLRNLPQPVLAAIVLTAVASLVKISELRHLWKVHRSEFIVAMVALLGVLWAGLLKGVLIGAIISLVLLIRRASSPHVAFLGRIPGARRYSDLERHPDNEATPGVLAFRVESGIVYFNAGHVFDTVLVRLEATGEPLKVVICDLSTSPNVDMAGARMLLTLHAELAKRGIAFRLVEARSTVRDMLRVEGVEKAVGHIDRFTTLADAIEHFKNGTAPRF